jgi:hypothetical protein
MPIPTQLEHKPSRAGPDPSKRRQIVDVRRWELVIAHPARHHVKDGLVVGVDETARVGLLLGFLGGGGFGEGGESFLLLLSDQLEFFLSPACKSKSFS